MMMNQSIITIRNPQENPLLMKNRHSVYFVVATTSTSSFVLELLIRDTNFLILHHLQDGPSILVQ